MAEAVDIGVEKLNEVLRSRGAPDDITVAERRRRTDEFGDRFPVPETAKVEKVEIAGRPAEWVSDPAADEGRVMLYVHGGGYVQGSLHSHRNLAYDIARAMGGRVLNLDYRLAPEHPFPAAVDDTVAAWKALLDGGADPKKAAFGGDSAGGGLVVAALVAARDQGLPMPACACCISPWTDLVGTGQTVTTKADADPMVTKSSLHTLAGLYAGDEDRAHPLLSPIYADLAGLPPLLIQVGTAEILLDDSRRLAARARHARVPVDYAEWEGMPHIWHIFGPLLQKSRDALAELGAFVRREA